MSEKILNESEKKEPRFTGDMKATHTILIPMMLPIHFNMIAGIMRGYGYKVELLQTTGRQIVDEGLKNVHNDSCYPALLVIGQMIDALKSGKYDPDKTALILTQTGGGCRASNYLFLLKKALINSGFPNVPVIPLNMANIGSGSDFVFSPTMLIKIIFALIYGDMIMWISNQCKPYEIHKGDTQKLIDKWVAKLTKEFEGKSFLGIKKNYKAIAKDFSALELSNEEKVKVTIVGEIYMKYASLGNNCLEDFLIKEGAEPVLSGVLDFLLYCMTNSQVDYALYGIGHKNKILCTIGVKYFEILQNRMIKVIAQETKFRAPTPFEKIKECTEGFIDKGAKMGEGWLLTAEMVESIKSGITNIVCAQPFGCLPNHIIAKGMMRKIKDVYPLANIVAVDYDPSATAINQENRLKLMLSNARLTKKMSEKQAPLQITWQEKKETVKEKSVV